MQIQVTHETLYDYAPAVETAQHLAYLRPLHTPHQRLLSHSLEILPPPAQLRQTTDVFGNTRCFFSLQAPHLQLSVVATSVVDTTTDSLPASSITWEETRERLRYRSDGRFDTATEFLFASPFCPRDPAFGAYARPSFTPGAGVMAAALDLMRRIHGEFTYESQSTEINTPALQALAQRKGVCQDFAHIMIACLRAMEIPARYVSGYLLTVAPPGKEKLRGSDASHAWVAVYLPDLAPDHAPEACWFDLDPTNNRAGWHSPGEDYVTLAIGRDFSDVSPIRGVIHGGASHTLTVGVTVEPMSTPPSTRTHSQSQGQNQSQNQSQRQFQGQAPD